MIRVPASSPSEDLSPDMIGEDCRGAIIVAGGHLTGETLAKAMKSGAKGIVAGSASYTQLTVRWASGLVWGSRDRRTSI